jgi:uncharacterized membrane protein
VPRAEHGKPFHPEAGPAIRPIPPRATEPEAGAPEGAQPNPTAPAPEAPEGGDAAPAAAAPETEAPQSEAYEPGAASEPHVPDPDPDAAAPDAAAPDVAAPDVAAPEAAAPEAPAPDAHPEVASSPAPAAPPKKPSRLDRALVAASGFARERAPRLALFFTSGLTLGTVFWFLRDKNLAFVTSNKLKLEQQVEGLTVPAVLALVFLLVGALTSLGAVRRRPWGEALMSRTAAIAALGLTAPLVLAMLPKKVESDHPKFVVLLSLLVGAVTGYAAFRWKQHARTSSESRPRPELAAKVVSVVALLGLWVAYSVFFSRLAIVNHQAMNTRTIDLGIYDQIFYQSAHGNFLGCNFVRAEYHGSAHFDPILAILSPLYLLHPRAETILVLQSVWVGSGVIPVYLMTRHYVEGRAAALVAAACYALHPALHGANMYEFHSLTLASVPIMWTVYCFITKKRWQYWVALGVALLVREDVPLMLSALGFAGFMSAEAAMRRRGLATILTCGIYFAVVKTFFMTSKGVLMQGGAESYSFSYYYADMIPDGKGVGGMILTLLTNPAFVLHHAITEAKVLYMVKLVGPLLFLPLLAKGWRWLFLYGLAFITLATREPVYSFGFQYSTVLLPFVFITFPLGLARLLDWFGPADGSQASAETAATPRVSRAAARAAVLFACLGASLALSWKYGGVLENTAFRGGFFTVARELTEEQRERFEWLEKTKATLDPKASVGVSNRTGPHLSNRKDVHFYGKKGTQYVFVDEKDLKKERLNQHKKAIRDKRLVEIDRHGTLALFKASGGPKRAPAPKAPNKVEDPGKPDDPAPEGEPEDEPEGDFRDVVGDDEPTP